MGFRRTAAASLATAGVIALAACSLGPTVNDAERYRAELSTVPGLTDSEVLSEDMAGIPAPPIGSVLVTVPADKAVIDAVIEKACATADRNRTELVITITDGSAVLQRVDEGCPSNTLDLAAVFDEMSAAHPSAHVWLGVDSLSGDLLIADYDSDPYQDSPDHESVVLWMPTLEAIYRHAGGTPLVVRLHDIVISSAPASQNLATVEALSSLARSHHLQQIWLTSNSLVVTVPGHSYVAAANAAIKADPAFDGLDAEVLALPLESYGGVVTAPIARLAEAAFSLGADDVYVDSDDTLKIQAPAIDTIAPWADKIASVNSDDVQVAFWAYDGKRKFEVLKGDPALSLTTEENPYPRWVDWYRQIAEVSPNGRNIVGEIRFGTSRIEVFRPDETEITAITAVVDRIGRDNGLSTYWVNGVEYQLD